MTGEARKGRSKWDAKGPPEIVEISEDESLPMNMVDCKGGNLLPNQNLTNGNENRIGESVNIRSDASMLHDSSGNKQEQADGFNKDIKERPSKTSSERSQPLRTGDEDHNKNGWCNRSLEKATGNQGMGKYAGDRRRDDGWGTALSRGYSSRMSSGPDSWKQCSRSRSPPSPRGGWNRSRRFPHEDGVRRQFDEHYPSDSRERYGHLNREFIDSREQDDYLRSRPSRGAHYDEGTWERSQPRGEYRSTVQCHDFVKGRCSRGANCRFIHDDSASHGGWRDEVRDIGRGGTDSSLGTRTEHRRTNKKPCKFFAEGRCRRGQNCPYLHEETSQSQVGLGAPDKPLDYNGGRTRRGNYLNWGEQSNAVQASSHVLSRDDRENTASQGADRSDSRYENKNRHSKDAGSSQYQIIPPEDFGSLGQNKPEIAASQPPQFVSSIQTGADSINNDKVSDSDIQSGPGTIGNLSMQIGMHAPNLGGEQSLGQQSQSQDAIPQSSVVPFLPVTTQLQNITSSLPLNSQMQKNDFSLHPNMQDQFVVPHATSNESAPSIQSQPVAPYMGHSQHGYIMGAQALSDISAHNGQIFNVIGQAPQNVPTIVHAGQSKATSDTPKLSRDSGDQSFQNIHNFQSVSPNEQTQNQTFQGVSVVASSSSVDMVGAPLYHNVASSDEAVRRVTASLVQYFVPSLTADTTGLQSSLPNPNSSLINNSSAVPRAVQPNHWSWPQQANMVQPACCVPSEQPAPQTFQVPMAAGSSNGNPLLLPHSVAPTGPATIVAVNEHTPAENKIGEPKDTDAEAHEDGENKKSKDSKALKMFKLALADFVKDALKPTWKEGQLSRELHKTIVKKVIDKVTSTVENIPQTKEKIDIYMSYSREKLNKLVQAYVGKYVKT
ncbi:hypothetical protein GUJ93_ZPchr0008g13006 [Zizania palustris]|uniref:C3H1-type domain-containing protein n=1 Tax=Zizania palustris TaxID=103762 RepID=A0A8J5VG04_ZIZPA|nr:hypothetical protein GUJ93_ZPchr0008g13006 [Zizania palustris]